MWTALFSALALVFVLEGILPFLCPDCWRRWAAKMTKQSDQSLRLMGLVSMIIGLIILFLAHHQFF